MDDALFTTVERLHVYGIGSVLLDRIYVVDQLPDGEGFPETGQKLECPDSRLQEVLKKISDVGQSHVQIGGPVPIALSVHAAWSQQMATFFAFAGTDATRWTILGELHAKGVRAQLVSPNNSVSASSIIWVDKNAGNRSILYSRGSKIPISDFEIEHLTLKNHFEPRSILHIDATEPIASKFASEQIREKGGLVYLDTGDFKTFPDGTSTLDILELANIIQLPLRCAREVVKKIGITSRNVSIDNLSMKDLASIIHAYVGNEIVVVTDGKNGCGFSALVGENIDSGNIPAYTGNITGFSKDTIDENGAGDIFAGSFSYALSKGNNVRDSLDIASITAASSTRLLGNDLFTTYQQALDITSRLALS